MVARGNELKEIILGDNDAIPPNHNCALNQWVEVKPRSPKE